MLRKLFGAGAIVALLAGPAAAQSMNMLAKERQLTPEEQQREREIEEHYRDAVSKLPDKKKSNDPWGNVRQAPAASSATRQQRQ